MAQNVKHGLVLLCIRFHGLSLVIFLPIGPIVCGWCPRSNFARIELATLPLQSRGNAGILRDVVSNTDSPRSAA